MEETKPIVIIDYHQLTPPRRPPRAVPQATRRPAKLPYIRTGSLANYRRSNAPQSTIFEAQGELISPVGTSGVLLASEMSSLLPGWLQPGSLAVFSGDDDGTAHRRAEGGGDNDGAQPGLQRFQAQSPHQGYKRPSQSSVYPARFDGPMPPAEDVEPDRMPSHFLTFPILSFTLGFGTGMYQSASRAGLVFMAENAHRRPETVQGWYFYNKTKVRPQPRFSLE